MHGQLLNTKHIADRFGVPDWRCQWKKSDIDKTVSNSNIIFSLTMWSLDIKFHPNAKGYSMWHTRELKNDWYLQYTNKLAGADQKDKGVIAH